MRRLVLILALALAPLHSYAQQTKVWTENLSTASTLGAAEAATTLNIDGRLGVGVQITTANLAATITPEVSCDKGVTWVASTFTTVAGVTAATLVFSGGADTQIRQIATIGCTTHVRVRVSAYTSGTSVGRITATATRAASAGGGAASSVTPGSTTVTGCQNLVLYGDNSQNINCEAGMGYDATANQLLIPDGTSTVPSLSFAADTNTGWYRSGADVFNEIFGGSRQVVHTSQLVGYLTSYQIGWYSGSFAAFDTGLSRNGSAGVIRATDGATGIRGFLGGGAAVASATALPVPTGSVFHVTGTTNITSITSTNFQSGAIISIIFDGILTFTDGNNIVLNTVLGNYVTTADDTITLAYDGTNWYELSRSAN